MESKRKQSKVIAREKLARKKFKRYKVLTERAKEISEELDEIKGWVKTKLIRDDEGFFDCGKGEGFLKSTRAGSLSLNEEKAKELSTWKDISDLKRIFNPKKAEKLIKKGKLDAADLRACYNQGPPSFQCRVSKREEQD
jgi:hypothetical protein